MNAAVKGITPFLIFTGNSKEAMKFYTSIFEESEIMEIIYYGPNASKRAGKVKYGRFSLKGQEFMCMDTIVEEEFTFNPAMSLYVKCDTEEEINGAYKKLSKDGTVLIPLMPYSFSEKFTWIEDKFGVSWQLSL